MRKQKVKPIMKKKLVDVKVGEKIEIVEEDGGLKTLLGKSVLVMCGTYFYHGKLTGVNTNDIELSDAGIVYETGDWSAEKFKRKESPAKIIYIRTSAIESYFEK